MKTPGSKVRDSLQKQDKMMAQALNVPSVRFVEKAGTTILQDVGQSDSWAKERFCPRKNCWHCQGRHKLLQEEEERAVTNVTGEATKVNPPKDSRTSIPGCTAEGINYVLECSNCTDKRLKRHYWGELSRSPFQRGRPLIQCLSVSKSLTRFLGYSSTCKLYYILFDMLFNMSV